MQNVDYFIPPTRVPIPDPKDAYREDDSQEARSKTLMPPSLRYLGGANPPPKKPKPTVRQKREAAEKVARAAVQQV